VVELARPEGSPVTLSYSVVIVTYRRPTILDATLRALLPVCPPGGEVIVVDQRPTVPPAADLLADKRMRYLTRAEPSMVEARNAGIRAAGGRVILFVDDDVVPLPGLIESHLAAYADPRVGAVAGYALDRGTNPRPVPHPSLADPALGWRYAHFDHPVRGPVATARGCNMSFRRDLLIALGGFDPGFVPPYSFREDTDASFRVHRAGHTVLYEPAAGLIHLSEGKGGTRPPDGPGSAAAAEWRRYRELYLHERNNLYFLLKHFRGRPRLRWLWDAYRSNVGASRWPWRLVAKNLAFAAALAHAARLARYRRHHPCRLAD
jgi:GT2 family glycosyltransferase